MEFQKGCRSYIFYKLIFCSMEKINSGCHHLLHLSFKIDGSQRKKCLNISFHFLAHAPHPPHSLGLAEAFSWASQSHVAASSDQEPQKCLCLLVASKEQRAFPQAQRRASHLSHMLLQMTQTGSWILTFFQPKSI